MGCEAHDFPAQHLVWAKNTTTDVPGPRDSVSSLGLEPAGVLRPHPQPQGYPRFRPVGLIVVHTRGRDRGVGGHLP